MLLLAGVLLTTSVSAYTVVGGVVQDGTGTDVAGESFISHIGNVHLGLPAGVRGATDPNWIGSDKLYTDPYGLGLSSQYSYVDNVVDQFATNGTPTVHWYQFTSDILSLHSAFYEWGTDLTSFTISFFLSGDNSDSAIYSRTFTQSDLASYTNNHLYENDFANISAGEILMRIEGTANGVNSGYKVHLSAVPLPPAALLFISALAGFGVIGRKKPRSA
jgi:hypothetical protein